MIYFIKSDDGFVKIGTSEKVKERLIRLQIATPHKLTLLHTFEGDQKLENKLHKLFKDHHVRGEWFKYCQEIENFINRNPYCCKEESEFIFKSKREINYYQCRVCRRYFTEKEADGVSL